MNRIPRAELDPRPAIIGFTQNHWFEGWTSRKRIMLGLAERGWPTVYSSGARTVWDRKTESWREQPWMPTFVAENQLRVDAPGRLLLRWPNVPICDRVALALHGRHLRRIARGPSNSRPVALLFHPAFWPYVEHLDARLLVYYVHDAYRRLPGWTAELARFEERLIARADLVVAYAQGMLDALQNVGRNKGTVVSTGVDCNAFEAPHAGPPPQDLEAIPRPRIGYAGRINQKLDFSIVLDIARRRPEWHWVFVGAVGAYPDGRFAVDGEAQALWERCRDRPNVHVLGYKPHAEIPRYLLGMDVNAMCYRTSDTGWWSEIFPLKSMEYLAAGKPIVSTRVKSMLSFADNIAFASTADGWVDAIEHALVSGGIGTARTRRAVARANSWDHKIDDLDRAIVGSLAMGESPAGAMGASLTPAPLDGNR